MAQIQAGTSYSTGMAVTAANLNAHVNNATLQEGCISAQTTSPLVSSTDNILVSNGSALNKTTLASIISPLNLFDKSQAQTLGQNVSFASGADIALASGSVISLSSGAILTLGQDPVSALQAVPKQYVDNGFLSKATGGLVSGSISMIGTSSILTLSTDPIPSSASLQAATKGYVDNTASRAIAKIRLQTTTGAGSSTPSLTTQYQITAQYTQVPGSTEATISVTAAAYNALWADSTKPFFLEGQYIGILSGTTGLSGTNLRLYKIVSVNYQAKTILITAPDTTARSTTCVLSCVYFVETPPSQSSQIDSQGNKNIKSVYLCQVSGKHYINYWYDAKGTALDAIPTEIDGGANDDQKIFVTGTSVNNTTTSPTDTLFSSVVFMRKSPTQIAATAPYESGSPIGFGASSKGVHIGLYHDSQSIANNRWIWDSNIVISE